MYIAGAYAAKAPLAGVSSVSVSGMAAGAVALTLAETYPRVRATVIAAPSEIEAMRRLQSAHDRVTF